MLGWHWILDGRGCDVARAGDAAVLARLIAQLPGELGLAVVGEPQLFEHGERPAGRTLGGLVLLSESHLSVHLRPDAGLLHADVFSCAEFDPALALARLREAYRFSEWDEHLLHRVDGGAAERGAAR